METLIVSLRFLIFKIQFDILRLEIHGKIVKHKL